MHVSNAPQTNPIEYLRRFGPDSPVMFFCPAQLQRMAHRFQRGFKGLTTYAVKANDRPDVLVNLSAAGMNSFDVASPTEMDAVRAIDAQAVLHYNNPVRSAQEIAHGIRLGVASWSVDDASELDKLDPVPRSAEIAVRFALPVAGAAYDFGEKFGATPDEAIELLRRVEKQGWRPSLCFHPGTQCADPSAWTAYIAEAARIAKQAGVRIARLNVGGGFPAHRTGAAPDLERTFSAIHMAVQTYFPGHVPELLCEPGRAMVAEAFVLAARVKSIRAGGRAVYLNDGIYGGLTDLRDTGLIHRVRVVSAQGIQRTGAGHEPKVFGPTCDSLDKLPGGLVLPSDLQVGDYVLFDGMGAYSLALNTGFNGYGVNNVATVLSLTGQHDL